MTDIAVTLTNAWPGAQWSLRGNDYATLEWHGPGEKPTLEELEAAWPNAQRSLVVVSMVALRLTLIEADLEPQILAAIAGIPDAKQKAAATAWWQTAQTVRRMHPLVIQLATAIGKTDAEIDAIFASAKQLETTL